MTLRNARYWIWSLVSVWSLACAQDSQAFPGGKQGPALETAVWTKVVAPSIATARAANVFVYDEARENCVVFGGRPVDDHGSSLEDTGIWSGETWVPVAAEYGRRGNVTGAFDTRRERTVVYGGTDGFSFFDDTWEFDGSWWTRHRVRSPGDRSGNGLAYDSRRNVTVLFGGYGGRSWKDEVWEWDGNTWTPGCTAEPCSVAPRPAARANAVFVYDDAREVSLLFGGSRDGETYDDTWTWDGERWRRLHPVHVPLARASAAATYDPVGKRVLLFGGLAAGLQELNDFWAWDGHDWTPISQATTPFARHGAGMAWHAKDRHGILFGGSASGNETDAWEFKLFGTPCTTSADCHVGTCVQGSCPAAPDLTENVGGGGSSAGDASGGWAGDPSTANGGSGCGCGGRQTNPGGTGGSAVGDAGQPPAASGGTAADAGGAGGAPRVASLTRDDTAPARSFYSCALSPTSRAPRASVASIAVLGGFATWLLRWRWWRAIRLYSRARPPAAWRWGRKKGMFLRMVRALSAGLLLVTWATTARAEEPRASSSAAPVTTAGSPAASIETAQASCGAPAPSADAAAEERAFSTELESFARRRMFTERLIAKREAEAFEQAALRQARAAELNRQLTEREAARAEREFEEAVALYLKKRELTRALSAAASRAPSTPADSASVPRTTSSP